MLAVHRDRRWLLAGLGIAALLLVALLWTLLAPRTPSEDSVDVAGRREPAQESLSSPTREAIGSAGAAPDTHAPVRSPDPSAKVQVHGDEPPVPTSPEPSDRGGHLAIVVGRAIDSRTREPVPDLSIDLACGRVKERVITAVDGSFESKRSFPRGTLEATVRDLESLVARIERSYDPELDVTPWILEVGIGPTIPLDIRSRPDFQREDFTARIVESARRPGIAGEILVQSSGDLRASALVGLPDREWTWIPVRTGTRPWVRYPSVAHGPDPRFTPRVELRGSRSGLEGSGPLDSTIGIRPPVEIEPRLAFGEITGALETRGSVRDGTTIAEGGRFDESMLLLLPARSLSGASGKVPIPWHESSADGRGRFLFPRVAAGDWILAAYAAGHRPLRRDVRVVGGPVDLGWLDLERVAGSIELKLIYFGNTPEALGARAFVRASLVDAAPYGRAWLKLWGTNEVRGSTEAHWQSWFDEMPAAEYDVNGLDLGSPAMLKPYRMRVNVPGDPVELAMLSGEQEERIGFDVRDASSGAPIPQFDVSFGPVGNLVDHDRADSSSRWQVVKETAFTWTVSSDGHQPASGDQGALDADSSDGAVRVALSPGWGTTLHLRGGNPRWIVDHPWPWTGWTLPNALDLLGALAAPPIRGVEVLVDGKVVATSDANGAARVALTERPSRLTLVCEGWNMVDVNRYYHAHEGYVVWMGPE